MRWWWSFILWGIFGGAGRILESIGDNSEKTSMALALESILTIVGFLFLISGIIDIVKIIKNKRNKTKL